MKDQDKTLIWCMSIAAIIIGVGVICIMKLPRFSIVAVGALFLFLKAVSKR
ncbi:MAG: hypothetical protein MJZ34_06760 [Paludibacteraceae bacterium]|nr:hypothetical protein [Paludibacteraceae bacterium]